MQMIREGREAQCKLDRGLQQNFGLTYPQFEALKAAVEKAGTSTLGAIADVVGCSRGNLTGIADRLERDGWIERDRSKEDRRVVHIRIVKDFVVVDSWVQSQN